MFVSDPVWTRPSRWCAAWLLLVVSGCANREVAGTFQTDAPPPFSSSGQDPMPDRWWTTFNDPRLDHQINQSLRGNFSLAAALQRVLAARALARREASDLLPDVNGVVDIEHLFQPGIDVSGFVSGFDATYPVDLWGEIGSRVDAQRLRASATSEDYQAVALTLSAEVARTWFSLIEAHAQLELLDEQIATNRAGYELQKKRFRPPDVGLADVLRQEQLVESTLEQAAVVKARIEVLEHQLAVLLGLPPQTASFDTGSELPSLPPLPDTGLPSELLNRRPDVRRDYLAFVAADRDLASAISAQYPRIDLTGSLLNITDTPETLFRDWFLTIGGQLVAPLFDGGQRRAEVDRTAAVVRQRFNEYGETMLVAFQQVEDALAREQYQLERIEHLTAQLNLARQASDRLRAEYLVRETDYLDVLSSITAQQRLQRETLAARLELILIRISLYLALAGDFGPPQRGVQDFGMQDFGMIEEAAPGIEELPSGSEASAPEIEELPPEIEELLPEIEALSPESVVDE